MTQLSLTQLTQHFGTITAVDNLNLDINSGELVAFLGPSGCGKTTTLRMITGLLEPSSGDVLFDGRSVKNVPTEKRGAVMVFQKHLLFPTMDVARNVGFGLKMRGESKVNIDKRVAEMLELVQLPGYQERQPHELSGGQQQRIALARALIVQPKVLLLDEPLANLDANLRLDMRELIRNIQQELGITTIFVTHDQEEAVMLADRVALMFNGKLEQFDVPQAFYKWPKTENVARFFRNNNFLSGRVKGDCVETVAGSLKVNRSDYSDGSKVLVTVRPENIDLAGGGDENLMSAKIVSQIYMGTHIQVILEIAGETWQAQGPANYKAAIGDRVMVGLPCEHIWLIDA